MSLSQIIHTIAQPLTHLPVNIWLPLMFITAPVLVFLGKPTHDWRWRVGRLMLACVLTYFFMQLSYMTANAIMWSDYQACQSQFPDGLIQHHPECDNSNMMDSGQVLFFEYFGWLPVAGYIGFWEFLWYRLYKKNVLLTQKTIREIWLISFVILSSIPLILFALHFIT